MWTGRHGEYSRRIFVTGCSEILVQEHNIYESPILRMWYHYVRLGRLITCCQHDIRVWLSAPWYIAAICMLMCALELLVHPHIIYEAFQCAKDIRL